MYGCIDFDEAMMIVNDGDVLYERMHLVSHMFMHS